MMLLRHLLLFATVFIATNVHALTAEEAKAISIGDGDARVEALNKAMVSADDKTAAFLQALSDDAVKLAGDKVLIVRDGKGLDPVTGTEIPVPEGAEDVMNNNRMRGELDSALAALKLFSKDEAIRIAAIKQL